MKISCRRCGKFRTIKSEDDLICCGRPLVKVMQDHIITSCEECDLGQQVPMDSFNGWNCKSCLHHNDHPIKKPTTGKGYSFGDLETQKTTMNFDVAILERIDQELEEINRGREEATGKNRLKVKRGAYVRMVLKQHFGMIF